MPLYLNISQLPTYNKRFKKNDEQLVKNYNKIWEKVKRLTSIDFESKPVYGDYDRYILDLIFNDDDDYDADNNNE